MGKRLQVVRGTVNNILEIIRRRKQFLTVGLGLLRRLKRTLGVNIHIWGCVDVVLVEVVMVVVEALVFFIFEH